MMSSLSPCKCFYKKARLRANAVHVPGGIKARGREARGATDGRDIFGYFFSPLFSD